MPGPAIYFLISPVLEVRFALFCLVKSLLLYVIMLFSIIYLYYQAASYGKGEYPQVVAVSVTEIMTIGTVVVEVLVALTVAATGVVLSSNLWYCRM